MDDTNPRKRKHADEDPAHALTNSHGVLQHSDTFNAKRVRYSDAQASTDRSPLISQHSVADLPPEILQHIFSFVHPVALGLLLGVCRTFNNLLDPLKDLPATGTDNKCLLIRKQNDIWAQSRRLYLPGYPRPLNSMTELDMWKLLRVRRCQFCQRRANPTPSFLNSIPWTGGPGRQDVRTIWPFRIQCCGACIETKLRQETELLLSGSSLLRAGLPFALFTPSFNYVTSVTLRQQQPPPELKLTKYYYTPDIEELENLLVEVQALGRAAAEEWFKGLELSGKQKQDDAERLEQWESTLTARLQILPSTSTALLSIHTPTQSQPSVISSYSRPSTGLRSRQAATASPPRPFSARSSQYSGYAPASSFSPVPDMPLPSWTPAPGQIPLPLATGGRIGISDRPVPSQAGTGPSAEQLKKIQSDKRAEIEKRCQWIDPPIRASVLPFMDAFRTALSIPMPLNDSAWDHLKTRLLAQRQAAELREREYLARQETSSPYGEDVAQQRQPSLIDEDRNARTWAELGMPSRQKLKTFADEYITSIWDDGIAVTVDTAARFATELIVQVKKRFDASIVEEDRELASRGMVLPADSDIHSIRRLRLEDMKWLYDESVRPHTERFGREIFLCSQCEAGAKKLAFDGLIQHYAAKHTNHLSRGSVVVYWKSEWPKFWPFQTASDCIWDGNHLPGSNNVQRSREVGSMDWHSHDRPLSATSSSNKTSLHASGPFIRPRTLYEEHQDVVVSSAVAALEAIAPIKGLTDSVRLYVVINQVVRSFSKGFPHLPTLSLFADSVIQQPRLRRLRDLHDLRCRSCVREGFSGTRDDREYWLPQLLDHFHKVHIQHGLATRFNQWTDEERRDHPQHDRDWIYGMVDLPDPQIIRNVLHSPELEQHQFGILASAFPRLADSVVRGPERLPAWHSGRASYATNVDDVRQGPAFAGIPQRFHLDENPASQSRSRHIAGTSQDPRTGTTLDLRPSFRRYTSTSYSDPNPDTDCQPKPDERSRPQETYHVTGNHHLSHGLPFRPYPQDPSVGTHYRESSPQPRLEQTGEHRSLYDEQARGLSATNRAKTDADNFLNSFDPHEEQGTAMSCQPSARSRTTFITSGIADHSSGRASHVGTPSSSVATEAVRPSTKDYSPVPLARAFTPNHTRTSFRGQHETTTGFILGTNAFQQPGLYENDQVPFDSERASYLQANSFYSNPPQYYVERASLSPQPATVYARRFYSPEFDKDRAERDRSWQYHHTATYERQPMDLPLAHYEIRPSLRGQSNSQMYSPPLSGTQYVESRYEGDGGGIRMHYARNQPAHHVLLERRHYETPFHSRQADPPGEHLQRGALSKSEGGGSRDGVI